jgi:molybdenum cofactor guanylyltransferase
MGVLTVSHIAGIVLCGGESRRMGRPKAWLPFGGTTLLGHVAGSLTAVAQPVVVVAAAGQDLPPLPAGIEVARDAGPGRGPLQALAAGLVAVAGRADLAFATSCDAPFVRPAFVRRLVERLDERPVCLPDVDGFLHPLAAVYRVSILADVERVLARSRRRLIDLLNAVPHRRVTADELHDVDPGLDSLGNLNTPEDYAAAAAAVDRSHPAP